MGRRCFHIKDKLPHTSLRAELRTRERRRAAAIYTLLAPINRTFALIKLASRDFVALSPDAANVNSTGRKRLGGILDLANCLANQRGANDKLHLTRVRQAAGKNQVERLCLSSCGQRVEIFGKCQFMNPQLSSRMSNSSVERSDHYAYAANEHWGHSEKSDRG